MDAASMLFSVASAGTVMPLGVVTRPEPTQFTVIFDDARPGP